MATLSSVDERPKVFGWLKDFWGDEDFELPTDHFNRPAFGGAYTRLSCLVRRKGEEYLLKCYHLGRSEREGGVVEWTNYSQRHYDRHPIFPKLINGFFEGGHLPLAILISYFPYEFQGPSFIEVLACVLNLADVFGYFSRDGRIYFDLKQQSLRLDAQGGLRLIDFTDLLQPEDLPRRKICIPTDRGFRPPEGERYDLIYQNFRPNMGMFDGLVAAARELQPDAYHSYSLGYLTVSLLDGGHIEDPPVQARIRATSNPQEGSFSDEERIDFVNLVQEMLAPSPADRIKLSEIRRRLWRMLATRLTNTGEPQFQSAMRARNLLRTVTKAEEDKLACEIHGELSSFWR
ncbi:MAG: hypothetical protein JWM21_2972 [Acidobacteria bacterium]|nr:hypothetical protein [Acidobacteriota bacterium]